MYTPPPFAVAPSPSCPNALIDDPSWRELLAVENDSYRGCPHPLMMEGTEDEASGGPRWRGSPVNPPRRFTLSRCEQASENTMAHLADHVANSVLGSGNAVARFPTLAGEATYDGAYDESVGRPASCCDTTHSVRAPSPLEQEF